jgi:DNA-binding transcriptional LysR family regulator
MWLRDLGYFVAIVEQGSITRAARVLGISQPALTKSLRRLEALLKAKLLERKPHGVAPTPVGAVFAQYAGAIQRDVERALEEIASLRGGTSGRIVVGAGPTMLQHLLPEATARLLAERPGISVHAVAGLNDALLKSLRNGELDLVVSTLPRLRSEPDLIASKLFEDSIVVVARAGHPLRRKRPIRLADLAAHKWVMMEQFFQARQWLDEQLAAAGLGHLQPAIESDSFEYIRALVARSDMLTFLPRAALVGEEPADALLPLEIPGTVWRRPVGIIYRRGAILTSATQSFIAHLRAVCGSGKARRADGRLSATKG